MDEPVQLSQWGETQGVQCVYEVREGGKQGQTTREIESFDSFLNHFYALRVSYINSIHTSYQSETPGYKIMKRASNDMK